MRSLFLTQCLQFKVIPETLKSKPPRSQSSQFSSTQNNYKNLAISTSLKNLRFAQKDAKMAPRDRFQGALALGSGQTLGSNALAGAQVEASVGNVA